MVLKASIAESLIDTTVGLEVITDDTSVEEGSRDLATTRRVMSVSVTMPTRLPVELVMTDASLLFAESI
jgi:hypothetical protein